MENTRIAVISNRGAVLCFMENGAPNAMHYWNANLTEYVQGNAYTLEFETEARYDDSQTLQVGNHLSFRLNGRDYFLNILTVDRTEDTVKVTCIGLIFELVFETLNPYKATKPQSFLDYIHSFNFEYATMEIGVNEVSDKRITHEWTGEDTVLARLYSLADVFGAEIEFVTHLRDDYTLKSITLNIYRSQASGGNGVGTDKRKTILRYGKEITAIEKTENISDLCTAIRPFGQDKNGNKLTLIGYEGHAQDANGHYDSAKSDDVICCPEARDRFPSTLPYPNKDYYICKVVEYDTQDQAQLWIHALADLKKSCIPKTSFKVTGSIQANPGDRFTIENTDYHPALYLEARVIQIERHLCSPEPDKLEFDNFTEVKPQVNQSLIDQMNKLIEQAKTYQVTISTDNGVLFKEPGQISTLTARIVDGGKELSGFSFAWTKDGDPAGSGSSIEVKSDDFYERAVYAARAEDKDGTVRGAAEVTVLKLKDGQDAILLTIDSSNGSQFKNSAISTTLTVTIFVGETRITDSEAMNKFFGTGARIVWTEKKLGETSFSEIPTEDPRLSDNGFIFTISAKDIHTKSVFNCELDA